MKLETEEDITKALNYLDHIAEKLPKEDRDFLFDFIWLFTGYTEERLTDDHLRVLGQICEREARLAEIEKAATSEAVEAMRKLVSFVQHPNAPNPTFAAVRPSGGIRAYWYNIDKGCGVLATVNPNGWHIRGVIQHFLPDGSPAHPYAHWRDTIVRDKRWDVALTIRYWIKELADEA